MGAKKDISQIKKYLNGELDAHAMHQLERQAQDDPFLMDALEGYEQTKGPHNNLLNDLDTRLNQRIDQQQVRRLITWKYYAAAASVLIVFTLGYLLWPATQQAPQIKQTQEVAKVSPPAPADHVVTQPDTAVKLTADNHMMAAVAPKALAKKAQSLPNLAPAIKPDNEIRIDEPVGNSDTKAVVEEAAPIATLTKKAKDTTALKEITLGYAASNLRKNETAKQAMASQTLQGKVDGVQVTTPNHGIHGTILDQSGYPLPGASVRVDGTPVAAVTDAQGHFSLPANGKATLNISSIGFTSQRITARENDSIKVNLNADNNSLAEVVVVGYGTAKKVKPIKEAHPKIGWDAYNNYLKRKAIAADGIDGTVRLSFIVDEKGTLSDFKVVDGLSATTNLQAIAIVKDGPAWLPDVSGEAKTIKLKIKFSKE